MFLKLLPPITSRSRLKPSATAETPEVVLTPRGNSFVFGNTATRFAGNTGSLIGQPLKNDNLVGRNNAVGDTLEGLSGNDRLTGRNGDDTLLGGKGGDTLIGGLGADTLDGGAGTDTANYAASGVGVTMTLAKVAGAEFADVSGGHAEDDTIKNVERIIGSNSARLGGDSIKVAFDTAEAIKYNVLTGNGADSLTVTFADAASTTTTAVSVDINFNGGAGVDTLILAGKLNLATLSINLGTDALGVGAVDLLGVENINLAGFTSNVAIVSLTGTAAANIITLGDLASVRVKTLAGNDIVKISDAVKGIALLDGGGGVDWLNFASRTNTAGVTLNLATGAIDGKETGSTLSGAVGSVVGFENVVGSAGADNIIGSRYNNVLSGGRWELTNSRAAVVLIGCWAVLATTSSLAELAAIISMAERVSTRSPT